VVGVRDQKSSFPAGVRLRSRCLAEAPEIDSEVEATKSRSHGADQAGGDIGIDRCVDVMNEEPALIHRQACARFEVLFGDVSGQGHIANCTAIAESKERTCRVLQSGRPRVQSAPKTTSATQSQ